MSLGIETNEQNASLIGWLKNKKSVLLVSGSWEPEISFLMMYQRALSLVLPLVNVLNTNFVQKFRTRGHWSCRWHIAGTDRKEAQRSGPNITKRINIESHIWVQKLSEQVLQLERCDFISRTIKANVSILAESNLMWVTYVFWLPKLSC